MATLLYSTGPPLHEPSPRHPLPMFSSSSSSSSASLSLSSSSYFAPPTPPHDAPPHPATIISSFSPHLRSPSPPAHPTTGSNVLMGRSSHHAFLATQSRVIRIFNLPKDPSPHLTALFPPHNAPLSLWSLRDDYGGPPPGKEDSVWAVFKSHYQAAAALSFSGATVSIATALESDLEPFQKLRKLEIRRHSVPSLRCPPAPSPCASPTGPPCPGLTTPLRASHSASDLRDRALHVPNDYSFTLSTNPPNPRNTFRQGDWICANPNCAAHNFMRNLVCIGCGNPRPSPAPAAPSLSWSRVVSSPRFAGASADFMTVPREQQQSPQSLSHPPHRPLPKMPSLPSFTRPFTPGTPFTPGAPAFSPIATNNCLSPPGFSPTTPSFSSSATSPASPTSSIAAAVALKLPSLLTPSGRAFARGGKVQNVSSDPLAPCVLYWPDNEPRPSQRQIRPPGPGHAAPILNTGNKGPIEQQPGDWVCGICDYLNWRRRKVCQTCYPYAEGNTDGVSAAVQAERIAMLAQVLAAHPRSQPPPSLPPPPQQQQQPSQAQNPTHPHAHTIPTPPNDTAPLPPPTPLRLDTSSLTPPPWSLAFLNDDDSTPPLSSASPSPQTSLLPLSGTGQSIWALRTDEV